MEDEKIIGLFFERSEQAITELDIKYGKLCYKLAYNILGSVPDAQECINDAWLGAWNAIPPARPSPLAAYLCKIVRNLSLKRYHAKTADKRGGGLAQAEEELAPWLPAPRNVENEVDARELASVIEKFLDTLSGENRVIFLRRYWFADAYDDIAKRTGLSKNNVSVRLVRMRRQMKQFLTESGVLV